MQQRAREAETCEVSFFDRDYLTSIDQQYADWLEPLPNGAGMKIQLVAEADRIIRIRNRIDDKRWADNTIIIKTHDLDAHQVYLLFENQLVHIISMTAANRREIREPDSVTHEN